MYNQNVETFHFSLGIGACFQTEVHFESGDMWGKICVIHCKVDGGVIVMPQL